MISRIWLYLLAGLLLLAVGCAGSIPSIPDAPAAIIEKANRYYDEGKFFQSAELYKAFLARYPGDDQSDYAQYRLAESYFHDEQYTMAAVEFQLLISNYGYSDYVDDALFMVGVSFWEDAPSVERDQQKVHDALSRFEQFLQTFPRSPLVPDVQRHVRMAHERLAHKAFLNLRWYYRIRKYDAALIYCDKIIDKYRDNEYWARALYHKGLIMIEKGEREEAARFFSEVINYPDDIDVKQDARRRLEELRQ